jgi:hypothetical protein
MEAHDQELGPIDIAVIAYPAGAPMTGDAAPLLVDLVERGIIRVLDAMFVRKNDDGTFEGFEARTWTRGASATSRSLRVPPPASSARRTPPRLLRPSSPAAPR